MFCGSTEVNKSSGDNMQVAGKEEKLVIEEEGKL